MTNYQIADIFSLLAKLSDIHGENSFKVKSYSIAAFNIEKTLKPLAEMSQQELYDTKGIGSGTGKKIEEIIATGTLKTLEDYIEKTPGGILQMLQIKGLGPKKIQTIWKELAIESVGELLYACNENRLLLYKGFGEKNQKSIKESIEFYLNAKGSFLFAQVEQAEPLIREILLNLVGEGNLYGTGNFKRHVEIIDFIEYVIPLPVENIKALLEGNDTFELTDEKKDQLIYKNKIFALRLCLYSCSKDELAKKIFDTTGSPEFNEAFYMEFPNSNHSETETEIFTTNRIQYIPAFLREAGKIINLAKNHKIPACMETKDIKGIIHSHSNWSDGSNTIEEMVVGCIEKGFEYLVISDHSKSAFYANGLNEERIKEQHIYIETLNRKYAPFKIFKSIESDILNDGSLDYSDAILSTFDLVIASVHSNLKMTEDKAMARLIAAIENPYTTILGHMTGRLLLSRPPYPVNYGQIIEACYENNVAIELNAHPSRLDIDWRQIENVLENDVLISINPDAHSINGYEDIRYGVLAAQKGMVQAKQNLSSFSLQDFEEYLFEIRERKGV